MRILITGGTGTIGHALTRRFLPQGYELHIVSRDEFKQQQMAARFPNAPIYFHIGDVRDRGAMARVAAGMDWVVHTAALKQVPRGETDSYEFQLTNVLGTENVLRAALAARVQRFLYISSDKAVRPTTTYGHTKALAERMVMNAAVQGVGKRHTTVMATRYGNVLGSRGSVLWTWEHVLKAGLNLPLTDPQMTRFWQTPDQAAELVERCLGTSQNGKVFIPKHRAMTMLEFTKAFLQATTGKIDEERVDIVGPRTSTEKRHEELLGQHEGSALVSQDNYWYILDQGRPQTQVKQAPPFVRYTSERPTAWIGIDEMAGWMQEVVAQEGAIAR